jgi:D-aminopeptidase
MAVWGRDAMDAVGSASSGPVRQGAIGAGSGMTSFGFRGGVGSSSRRIDLGGDRFIMGALVLSNFGRAGDLVLPDGRNPVPKEAAAPERGSVIVVLATDLPLGDRQLQRVARRAGVALARLGAYWGNGSGDISLCFTTADPVAHESAEPFSAVRRLDDTHIDTAFRAAADATGEAVLNALCASPAATGRNGRLYPSLADWLERNPPRPIA